MGVLDNPTGRRWGGLPRRRSIPHEDTRPEAEEDWMDAKLEEALTCCVCMEPAGGSLQCEECGGTVHEECSSDEQYDGVLCQDCRTFLDEPDCYCGRHPAYCCCP